MARNLAVSRIYEDRTAIDNCVLALRDAGFTNTDVAILELESLGISGLGTEKTTKAQKVHQWGHRAGPSME
jgi:hypothetical protein